MNLGAFAVVAALQRRPGITSQIATFTGLGYRAPVLALTMTVFLLSLTGIPPLAGFFAKAMIVLGALEVGGSMSWLAVIMMLNAAAAAFYYLRVVVYMYMRRPSEEAAGVSIGGLTKVGLVVGGDPTSSSARIPARSPGRSWSGRGRAAVALAAALAARARRQPGDLCRDRR
jgi:NADH:ubiquinone oxidoreductase subunit 2 (subunit N)